MYLARAQDASKKLSPYWQNQMPRSPPSSSSPRRRRRRQKNRIQELEGIVQRQAEELDHLLSHLRRVKPQRPRMSSTRSVWLAGKQGFKCAGDKTLCPCWLLTGKACLGPRAGKWITFLDGPTATTTASQT